MINISFKEWFLLQEAIQSILKVNPKKKDDPNYDFLLLVGNTFELKNKIKDAGFRWFQADKTWSMPRFVYNTLDPEKKKELEDAGISFAPFEDPRDVVLGSKAEIKVDQSIKQELETVKELATSGQQNEKINAILDHIIEEIANLTDEAKKSDLIKNFLMMASRLYKYSVRNQWLIFAQNPHATDVQSMTNWVKLGRKLKQDAEKNRMIIFAPVGVKMITVKDEKTGEEKKVKIGMPTRFKISYVYDIADTEPIPGAKDIYQPHSWRQDSNEPVEELGGIINALLKFAEEKKIPVDFKKLDFALGGYATKHGIVVNNIYDGMNKASTLVHELAHNMMHFKDNEAKIDRHEAEHDAESIAYVFLKHFGFVSKDSPTYLALWKADKDKIMLRSKNIKSTVSELIKAVEKYYKEAEYGFMDDESEEGKDEL